jgi:MFS family permease
VNEKIRRNFIVGIVSESLWGSGFGLFMPSTIVCLALVDLGGSPALAGFLAALFGVGLTLPQFFSALVLSPRFTDPRRLVALHLPAALGPALAGMGFWLLPPEQVQTRLFFLLGGFSIFCLGIGIAVPHWAGCIGRCLPEKLRGRYFGLSFFASGLCGSFTGWLGSRWVAEGGLRWGYALCFTVAPVLLALSILTMLFFQPLKGPHRPFKEGVWKKGMGMIRDKIAHPGPFRTVLVLIFLLNAVSAPGNLFTVYLKGRGVGTEWFQYFTPAITLGGMVGALGLGWLADHKGFRVTYAAVFGVGLFSLVGIYFPGSLPATAGSFAAFGFLNIAFPVVNLALVLKIAGHSESTLQQGLVSTLLSPWSFLAPLAAG